MVIETLKYAIQSGIAVLKGEIGEVWAGESADDCNVARRSECLADEGGTAHPEKALWSGLKNP